MESLTYYDILFLTVHLPVKTMLYTKYEKNPTLSQIDPDKIVAAVAANTN